VRSVYLYGVVQAHDGTEVEAPGVGAPDAGVRRIAHRDVAALVSDIEAGPLAAARELRAHWRVLEDAIARATVLPVRFGTVLESDEAVVERFLTPRHDELARQLAELAGKVQLTVKGSYEEDRLMRGVVDGSPTIARLRESVRGRPKAATYYDRIKLGELVAAEVEQARERDTVLVLERLGPLAVATRHEPPSSPEGAVNTAFLVERTRVDEFSRAVAALTDELGDRMRLRYVGPLPPYSFTEEEATAWA
jgi:Gas vesicle synthesis protein GvpL/GvpF